MRERALTTEAAELITPCRFYFHLLDFKATTSLDSSFEVPWNSVLLGLLVRLSSLCSARCSYLQTSQDGEAGRADLGFSLGPSEAPRNCHGIRNVSRSPAAHTEMPWESKWVGRLKGADVTQLLLQSNSRLFRPPISHPLLLFLFLGKQKASTLLVIPQGRLRQRKATAAAAAHGIRASPAYRHQLLWERKVPP